MELIAQKLKTLANARDWDTLYRKKKTINALLPYAIRQERDKEYAILDALLHTAQTIPDFQFSWRHIKPFLDKLFDGTGHVSSDRALILVSPYMCWQYPNFGEDRARIWVVAASVVPKEEEFAPSVVATVLEIVYHKRLPPHLFGDARPWLELRPLLPPLYSGRNVGRHQEMVRGVRDLGDIEILKYYLLLVWSEWDYSFSDGYPEMQVSIRRDFSGIEMKSHRADLLQRLDYILAELDRPLQHFQREVLFTNRRILRQNKDRYRELRETLLEVERAALEAPTRASSRLTTLFDYQLTRPHAESYSV